MPLRACDKLKSRFQLGVNFLDHQHVAFLIHCVLGYGRPQDGLWQAQNGYPRSVHGHQRRGISMTQQTVVSRCTLSRQPEHLQTGGWDSLFASGVRTTRTVYGAPVDVPPAAADAECGECATTKSPQYSSGCSSDLSNFWIERDSRDSITEKNRDLKQTSSRIRLHAQRDDKPYAYTGAWSFDIAEKKDKPCALPKTQNSPAGNGLFASMLFDSIKCEESFRHMPLVSDSKTSDTNNVRWGAC